jgi:hypothetical protein
MIRTQPIRPSGRLIVSEAFSAAIQFSGDGAFLAP